MIVYWTGLIRSDVYGREGFNPRGVSQMHKHARLCQLRMTTMFTTS